MRSNANRLASTLTKELTCGRETGFKTPFSSRSIILKGYVFVELKTSVDQGNSNYMILKMFMPRADFYKIDKIINTKDATNN